MVHYARDCSCTYMYIIVVDCTPLSFLTDLTTLYINLVTEALTPALYAATELTYSASLSATPRGLTLSISGFSDQDVMERFLSTALTRESTYDVGTCTCTLLCYMYTCTVPDLYNCTYIYIYAWSLSVDVIYAT